MSLLRLRKIDTSTKHWKDLLFGIVKKCLQTGPVNVIYVFGSFARNKMTEASDIDLAVIVPDEVDPREFREKLPRPVSSWPLDLLIVRQSRFDQRKTFGGVLFDVYAEGLELFPTFKIPEGR